MSANPNLEYLCPNCGHINELAVDEIKNMYSEQSAYCSQCRTLLSIVPADGMNDDINLVVTEVLPDKPPR